MTADQRKLTVARGGPQRVSRPDSQTDALLSPAMNGRADSEIPDEAVDDEAVDHEAVDMDDAVDPTDPAGDARRARWVAVGTGTLLALAGLAAAVLRAFGSAPARAPAAYAVGAAVCALAAVLGSRGRTRRALWLLVAGVMVMAVGDQFD